MKRKKNNSPKYMAKLGKKGGETSTRELRSEDAKAMQTKSVATRKANKRAKQEEGGVSDMLLRKRK